MKIQIEQSGGLSGIVRSMKMDVNNLPPNVIDIVNSIKESKPPVLAKIMPKGSADHMNYKITIEEGKRNYIFECNQYTLDSKLKTLIEYVKNNSKSEPKT